MKRFLCFAALLTWLSFSAFAVPKVDGILNPYEYDETLSTLQIPQHESNNNLSFAFLHWAASPADHSVYLGVQYNCTDHTTEDGKTGVMVYVNDELIGTIYAGGTVEGVDHSRYELEGFLDDGAWGNPYDSICEVRAGIKFWPEGEITAGVQILDFGGNPSNYYRLTVYSPQEPTTQEETTAARKTTTKKSTTAKSTTTTTAGTVTETTTRPVHTTAPVITAAAKREPAATTAAASTTASAVQPTVLQPAPVPSKAAASSKTTKPKTKKAETTKMTATKRSDAAETASDPADDVLAATAATTGASVSASETASAVSAAKMYNEANKAKIVGTVLVAVILTAAIMSSVFLGMRQKKDEPQHTPQEEYDDFG